MNLTTVVVILLIAAVIAIMALCLKKHPPGYKDESRTQRLAQPPLRIEDFQPRATAVSAKEAFLKNVAMFAPFLNQLNGALNREAWTEQIVNINNPLLTDIWRKSMHDASIWKRILSSWGLRQDTCQSFTYFDKYGKMYDTLDGVPAVPGQKYRVADGCWILTNEDTGDKTVVKKGKIEKL